MKSLVLCVLILLLSQSTFADPDDSVFTTYSENGSRQLDFKLGSTSQANQPHQSAAIIGLGYALTDRWFSELYLGYVRAGSDPIAFDSAALQNTFVLTDGTTPLDIGLFTEVEYEQDRSAGYQLMFGPLLQTEFGLTKVNFNFLFKRDYLADFSNPLQLGYQWQIKHRWNLPLEFGMQGFGELGQWDHWAPQSGQSHRLGPAIFGKLALGDQQMIHYNAAILFDVFDGQRATTFRAQIIYGF
jgi:hypothetical protein